MLPHINKYQCIVRSSQVNSKWPKATLIYFLNANVMLTETVELHYHQLAFTYQMLQVIYIHIVVQSYKNLIVELLRYLSVVLKCYSTSVHIYKHMYIWQYLSVLLKKLPVHFMPLFFII